MHVQGKEDSRATDIKNKQKDEERECDCDVLCRILLKRCL